MALSGNSEQRLLEQRIRTLEAELRKLNEAFNRQSPASRATRGSIQSISNLSVDRTEAALYATWTPSNLQDLRYYEMQVDKKGSFPDPAVIKTPDPYHTWTSGFGSLGFYFYVRVRVVSQDRRKGPWSPKFETSNPDRLITAPISGVLTLNNRTDIIEVGGSGAQTITIIRGGWTGRCVTLYFTVAHTVQDSTSIRLAGDFSATVNSTLTLMYAGDPVSWVEVARTTSI